MIKLINVDSHLSTIQGEIDYNKHMASDLIIIQKEMNIIELLKNRYGNTGTYYHKDVVDNLRNKLAEYMNYSADLEDKLKLVEEVKKKRKFKFWKK